MFACRRVVLFCVLASALFVFGCGDDPPEKEMQQAQGAIDAAQTAGAEEYAHDEFVAARASLTNASNAAGQRDYRLALTYALDSRERARNAAKQTADNKAAAREAADHAITATAAALVDIRARLRVAEANRVTVRIAGETRATILREEKAVQEARTAFGRAEYHAVTSALDKATADLRAAARDLDAATPPTPRRRR